MADVLSRRRWGTRWSWAGAVLGLSGLFVAMGPPPAPGQDTGTKAPAPGKAADKGKDAADDDDKDAAPAAPDVAGAPPADPSQSRRVAPVEIFKDPNAEAVLGLEVLKEAQGAPFTMEDVQRVEQMAQNPNLPTDRVLVERVVKGLAAKLTDRKSIKSLLEDSVGPAPREAAKKGAAPKKPEGDGGQTIQQATDNLLKPIFMARAMKNDAFLRDYRRSLHTYLPPLLKNHLIPRVQAMIILGEAASPTQEALQLFQSELLSRSQTLWVKLWWLEGIHNIKKYGGRFSADVESRAAKTIADFLEKHEDIPWLLQLRGLEAIGSLRQAYLPTSMTRADMANTVMQFLADTESRLEVRAEAALALALLQVGSVPRFNFQLVAHDAARLAADIAAEVNEQYSDSPPRAQNPTKAKYLVTMLVGPVYECFAGIPGENNSGILVVGKADPAASKSMQKVFDQIRPLAQASVELLNAPTKEFKARKQTLASQVATLRQTLTQNPPPSRKLVPNGREFGAGNNAAAARVVAPGPAMAGVPRGR